MMTDSLYLSSRLTLADLRKIVEFTKDLPEDLPFATTENYTTEFAQQALGAHVSVERRFVDGETEPRDVLVLEFEEVAETFAAEPDRFSPSMEPNS